MSGYFIPFRSSRFHYSRWGEGSRILFAFHGYGESAASFEFMAPALGRDYTIIALDMPFHGETEWREADLYFDPGDLLGLMEEISAGLANREPAWWLLGYSMGGRVALQVLELVPQRVRRLVLLAPDGLLVNIWYWIATRTLAGNRFFRWTMKRPGWLFLLMRAGNRLSWVNPSLFKFAAHYLDDETVRQKLYTRWTVMRSFRPHLKRIAVHIRNRRIATVLLYGKYDRIILPMRGERFLQRIEPCGKLELLTVGHGLLQPKFMEVIANALYLPII